MLTHRRAFHQYLRNLMLITIRLRSLLPNKISISTALFRIWSTMFAFMLHAWSSYRVRQWGTKVNKLVVMTSSPAIPLKTQRTTWKIVLEWESASLMFNWIPFCRDKMTFCLPSTSKTKSACPLADMAGALFAGIRRIFSAPKLSTLYALPSVRRNIWLSARPSTMPKMVPRPTL